MKLLLTILLTGVTIANVAYADIPYCQEKKENGKENTALQKVVQDYAKKYHCDADNSCLMGFDGYKYSIAWSKPCAKALEASSSPEGVTFTCASDGSLCTPLYLGGA